MAILFEGWNYASKRKRLRFSKGDRRRRVVIFQEWLQIFYEQKILFIKFFSQNSKIFHKNSQYLSKNRDFSQKENDFLSKIQFFFSKIEIAAKNPNFCQKNQKFYQKIKNFVKKSYIKTRNFGNLSKESPRFKMSKKTTFVQIQQKIFQFIVHVTFFLFYFSSSSSKTNRR